MPDTAQSSAEPSSVVAAAPAKRSRVVRTLLIVVAVIAVVGLVGYFITSRYIGRNWTVNTYTTPSLGAGPVPGTYLVKNPTSPISQSVKTCAGTNTYTEVRLTAPLTIDAVMLCKFGWAYPVNPFKASDKPTYPALFATLSKTFSQQDQKFVFGHLCVNPLGLSDQLLAQIQGHWMWVTMPTNACGMPLPSALAALRAVPHVQQ